MKKRLLLLLLALVGLSPLRLAARDFTYTYEGQTITYTVIDEEAKTCSTFAGYYSAGNSVSGDLILPANPKVGDVEYSLISISDYAFNGCRALTSIEIPNSVTSIGEGAFNGCCALTSIEIPNSVTSIGDYAFYGCSGLTSVTIVDGEMVLSLGYNYNSEGHYATGQGLFFNCSLEKLYLGRNLSYGSSKEYGYSPFHNQNKLHDITIGNSVTSIGDYAFSGCSGLTSVDIPNSVTTIGSCAFDNCSGLTSVEIPNSVTSIGDYAFSGCSGLTSVEIPNSVTSIGNYAFSGCSGLTSVEIPNSVTSIGDNAFYACSGLISVKIGNSVTSIGVNAFYGCSGLTKAEFASIESLCAIQFSYHNANPLANAHHLYIDGEEITELIIPESVESIGNYAFEGCSGMTSIVIPNSVIRINSSVFSGCSALKEVIFQDGKSRLALGYNEASMFGRLGQGLFYDCSLEKLYLGRNLSYSTLGVCGFSPFYNQKNLTIITIGNSVTSIYDYAFYDCSGLTSINIPNSVTSIGSGAFSGCSGLTSIEIPNSVTYIGTSAFWDCALEDVYYSSSEPLSGIFSIFSGSTYSNALLHLPDKAIEKAMVTSPWMYFDNITGDYNGIEASGISLYVTSKTIKEEETLQLTATVTPADATDQSVTWTSSDVTVATVDQNGTVTALKAGTATITAETANGLKATCVITVEAKTGVDGVEADAQISVAVRDGVIVVTAPEGAEVEVYSLTGMRVAKTREHRVEGLSKGVYIVSVSGKAFKVIVK